MTAFTVAVEDLSLDPTEVLVILNQSIKDNQSEIESASEKNKEREALAKLRADLEALKNKKLKTKKDLQDIKNLEEQIGL